MWISIKLFCEDIMKMRTTNNHQCQASIHNYRCLLCSELWDACNRNNSCVTLERDFLRIFYWQTAMELQILSGGCKSLSKKCLGLLQIIESKSLLQALCFWLPVLHDWPLELGILIITEDVPFIPYANHRLAVVLLDAKMEDMNKEFRIVAFHHAKQLVGGQWWGLCTNEQYVCISSHTR